MAAAPTFSRKRKEKGKGRRGMTKKKNKNSLTLAYIITSERGLQQRNSRLNELKTQKNTGLKTGITLRCNYVIRLRGTSRREV